MKKIILLLALVSIAIATPAGAQEKDFCKTFCASSKKVCRKDADAKVRDSLEPSIIQSDTNSANPEQDKASRLSERKAAKSEAKNMNAEMYHACDVSYTKCVSSCAQDSLNSDK